MIKIGIIDLWLNNWHTDHYPEYMHLASYRYGVDIGVTHAFAMHAAPEGCVSNSEWCKTRGITLASTPKELIDKVDAIMVMGADDCLEHETLAHEALASGKPVYCDKTFAPSLEAAIRMFDRAAAHQTPMFTCSAQRYVMELQSDACLNGFVPAKFCETKGPGDIVNYSIHQFEMVEYIMGQGAEKCMAFVEGETNKFVYQYKDGRAAEVTQGPKIPFSVVISRNGEMKEIAVTDYYMALMYELCKFFSTGIVPVTRENTLEIMAMQQAARQALCVPETWINVPAYV